MDKIDNFDDYKNLWLEDVIEGDNLSTLELGQRFARKLISQWLEISDDDDDIFYCDGSCDGGIDIAYLPRAESSGEDDFSEGRTWYVVQSKYGSAYNGVKTLHVEASKLFDTLRGKNTRLIESVIDVVTRIELFFKNASDNDKLSYVIATDDTLTEKDLETLNEIRIIGQNYFGKIFNVESVTIHTIFQRLNEFHLEKLKVPFKALLVPSGDDLFVGSIKISNLYKFLLDYKKQTKDLDLIYQKNVRKYLGKRKKVNIGIRETLQNEPEKFGIYNNGITIVVEGFEIVSESENEYKLIEPNIVNGCQTTRTIWNYLDPFISSGGTGTATSDDWNERLEKGVVIVKIVKVGESGEQLLINTTEFSNRQNAVADKDFIALDKKFQAWKKEFSEKYDIYLEIQRGDWDVQKALSKNKSSIKKFSKVTSAFDLIKIFSAGWLSVPGTAWGKNAPFVPEGTVFESIIDDLTTDDLFAAYLIECLIKNNNFSRTSKTFSRKQTKFLFCYVFVELIRSCLESCSIPKNYTNISKLIITILTNSNDNVGEFITKSALLVIDDYINQESKYTFTKEKTYKDDVNVFLKNDKLGKKEFSPILDERLEVQRIFINMNNDIIESLKNTINEIFTCCMYDH